MSLTPGELRQVATTYLSLGQPDVAETLARALLERDPQDHVAAILLIEARAAQGDNHGATILAAELYRTSADRDTRYIAARLAAREHLAQDQGTRAQLWLRRARQAAPSPAEAAEVAQDYAFVRARNPLQVKLDFGIAPSSNVNNGSAQTTQDAILFGLPFELVLSGDARALSGLSISAGVRLDYALAGGPQGTTFASLDLNGVTHVLSAAAKAQAPTSQGRDFSSVSARLGLRRMAPVGDGGTRAYGVDLGRLWAGGAPLYDSLGVNFERSFTLSAVDKLTFSGRVERQFSLRDLPLRDNAQVTARNTFDLANGASLSLSATLLRGWSTDAGYDYRGVALGADYRFGEPVLGGALEVGLDLAQREYRKGPLDPTARKDRFIGVQADYTFTGIEVYGFSPAITIGSQINASNSGRYDTRGTTLGFDLRSSF